MSTTSILDVRTPLQAPPAAASDVTSRDLGLQMQSQLQTEWCWAAVSTSVALFYEPAATWTQCTVVNEGLGQTTCCQDGGSSACNQPNYLEKALAIVGHLDRDFGGALGLDAIAAQIDVGRPIGLCIDWKGGGGHFVVVDGYDRATQTLDVKDPMFGPSHVPVGSFPRRTRAGARGRGRT
jgi:hypothetical protein